MRARECRWGRSNGVQACCCKHRNSLLLAWLDFGCRTAVLLCVPGVLIEGAPLNI